MVPGPTEIAPGTADGVAEAVDKVPDTDGTDVIAVVDGLFCAKSATDEVSDSTEFCRLPSWSSSGSCSSALFSDSTSSLVEIDVICDAIGSLT